MSAASELIERVSRAIVVVRTADGRGSGFFVHPRGLVVTNRHVVQDSRSVVLDLFDKTRLPALVVRAFQSPDLAFLLATTSDASYPSLSLTDDAAVRTGMDVYAIGHPGVAEIELNYSVSRGVISGLSRYVGGATYIQTDAALNPGNSGGPLVDVEGRVVGLSTLVSIDRQNLNFAVPVATIRSVLDSLVEHLPRLRQALYCPVCGESNARDVKYCGRCGQSFARLTSEPLPRASAPRGQPAAAELRRCESCERESRSASPYCPACGARYDRQSPKGDA